MSKRVGTNNDTKWRKGNGGELAKRDSLLMMNVMCWMLFGQVLAARDAGAVGAKMSGTGRGGLMLALTPTVEIQDRVVKALEAAGAPQVWKTTFASADLITGAGADEE
jgi:hypothetical protein